MDEIQLDALKEVTNIGVGNASIALSKLLGQKVELTIPNTQIGELKEISKKLEDKGKEVVLIYTKISDIFDANIILSIPTDKALRLVNKFLENKESSLSDKSLEILKKIGVAVFSSFLTSLAKLFKNKINFNEPMIVPTLSDQIFEFLTFDIGSSGETLLITMKFELEDKDVDGEFSMLFDTSIINQIFEELNKEA